MSRVGMETPTTMVSNPIPRPPARGIGVPLLILIALTAVGILAGFHFASGEPRYQGRSLSSWLADLDVSKPLKSPAVRATAQTAVREIGTNALPILRELIVAKEGVEERGLRVRAADWLARATRGRLNWYPAFRPFQAVVGYEVLGAAAEPAVPELAALLRESETHRVFAAAALVGIGSPSIGPLISCMSSDNQEVQRFAAMALGAIAEQPERCVPALQARAWQPDPYDALRSLGEFGADAVVALPQLESALTNSESAWFDAAYALAQLGEAGVLPLMRGLMNTNSDVRRASAAGLAWRNSLPASPGGPPLKMFLFMCRTFDFNDKAQGLSQRFYVDGEAATFSPVVAAYTQNTNTQVREAAALVTNRLGRLPPHVKQPIPYPLVPRYVETM